MKVYQPCINKNLLVLNQKTSKKVLLKDVILLRAETNYTHFILSSGTVFLVAHSIRFFEDFLKGHGFIRVHRRYMVNPSHVTNIDNSLDLVMLSNGQTAQISRRRKHNIVLKDSLKSNQYSF